MHRVAPVPTSSTRPDPRRRGIVFCALLLPAAASPAVCAAAAIAATDAHYDIVELGARLEPDISTGALAVDERGRVAGWAGGLPAVFRADGHANILIDRPGHALGFDREGRVRGRLFGRDGERPTSFVWSDHTGLIESAAIESSLIEAGEIEPRVIEPGVIEPGDEALARRRRAARTPTAATTMALPGAFFSEAYGRNRLGDAVGTSDVGIGTVQRAVLRRRGGLVADLAQLANVRAAGWRGLLAAYAINDRGVVVGVGERKDGVTRGCMLRPRST